MSHHVGCGFPGEPPSATVDADYRNPIVNVMRRILAAVADPKREPDPADYATVKAWARDYPEQVCHIPFTGCTHPPASPEPYTPPPYQPGDTLF